VNRAQLDTTFFLVSVGFSRQIPRLLQKIRQLLSFLSYLQFVIIPSNFTIQDG